MRAIGPAEAIRFVGGAVRDDLLGLPVSDIDLATKIRPDEVIGRLEKAKIKAVPTCIDHGTVTAVSQSSDGQTMLTVGKNQVPFTSVTSVPAVSNPLASLLGG